MDTQKDNNKALGASAEKSAQLTGKETLKLARNAFDKLQFLNNIDWHSHREKLLELCKAEEKDHRGFLSSFRESHTEDTASVSDAAKHFAVKRIAEYLNGLKPPTGKDYLHMQKSCFYAAGLVEEFGERIRQAWAEFDVPVLAELDYCQIVKVRQ